MTKYIFELEVYRTTCEGEGTGGHGTHSIEFDTATDLSKWEKKYNTNHPDTKKWLDDDFPYILQTYGYKLIKTTTETLSYVADVENKITW